MEFLHSSGHERFDYENLEEMKQELKKLDKKLPFAQDYSILFEPEKVGERKIPNSWVVQPMEGCDASPDGAPEKLTFRRYRRFGSGGSGLLWMEATAVKERGKANPRQLMLTEENAEDFKELKENTMKAAADSMGEEHKPLMVVQLTHSGRYSKPEGEPAPIIAHHSEILDPKHNLGNNYPLISDEELDQLQKRYIKAASLAADIGYEAVDIKACHGYLLNEILASHTRKDSKYGGDFENRSRFILEVVEEIKKQNPDLIVGTRLNVYDATPYPYGFGMAEDGSMKPDLTEPIKLIEKLKEKGLDIVNIATGNPYYNPHVERPFDTPVSGGYIPEEHPLENISKNMAITREINNNISEDILTVASGLSWLRQFIPDVGAGLKNENWCDLIGLGRAAFAYPDLPKDLLKKGELQSDKLCISCSSCTQMMRDGKRAGCPVRDSEIYAPIFKDGRHSDQEYVSELAEKCRDCVPATCRSGCPADVDIPGFIQAIADKDDKSAYNILRDKNNLPEVCAYICPVEAQCENKCVQNNIGRGPVPIQRLQRYVSETAREQGWTSISVPEEIKKEQIAIIGAGPAGLSCAIDLLEQGYKVTIFDADEQPGGMARDVIPEKRLKKDILRAEVNSILENVAEERLEWKFNSVLGENISLSEISKKYQAVFLGMGLQENTSLPFSDRPEGVISALEFLKNIKENQLSNIPGNIAVIGGGNTAMDAAVQAAENVSDNGDVYLLYRRSFDQMPAWENEREAALDAGVHFMILQQPVKYIKDKNGQVQGIKIQRTKLGEPDESGRRKPVTVEGTEQELKVELVIEAIGQKISSDIISILKKNNIKIENGLIKTKLNSTETDKKGIFAGGDIINGGDTVVRAISDGSAAAREISTG